LFPERLVVELSPSVVRVGEQTVPCDPAFGTEAWQGAVAALRTLQWARPSRVEVILSNHFVRYAVIPWSGALAGAAEEQAYVRHHFAKIHGEKAKGWLVRASPASAGAPRLASAIDPALLEEIGRAFPRGGSARLVSVQPLLMSRFNAWREQLPASGAWLVIAEGERACVALHAARAWRSVQNARGPWLELLERERYRAPAGEVPSLVLLAGAPTPAHSATWQFRELAA
jgi:hypothetical protein